MKAIVLGAGQMGSALGFDLAQSRGVDVVCFADQDAERVQAAARAVQEKATGAKAEIRTATADLSDDQRVRELIRGYDVAIGAADYALNVALTRAAIAEKIHACDLGGNIHVVEEQLTLDAQARRAGISVIPDCGVAPGMAVILAAHAFASLERADTIRLRCGGLPAHPKPPLNYKLVFSVRGLLTNYLAPSEVLRNGKLVRIESLAELEPIDFPPPFGRMEAAITSWGSSTLPRTLEGKVRDLDYKTIRYPGHFEIFRTLRELGLLEQAPVDVDGEPVSPQAVVGSVLENRLRTEDTDVLLLRVTAEGIGRGGAAERIVYELIDRHDETTGHSAMMRTTAYSTSIVAQLLGSGAVTERGVVPSERAVPADKFIAEIRARGFALTETRERM